MGHRARRARKKKLSRPSHRVARALKREKTEWKWRASGYSPNQVGEIRRHNARIAKKRNKWG